MSSTLNRCFFTAGNSGTGDFQDGTAVTGFRNLSVAGAQNGVEYSYAAENLTRTEWEYGRATYDSGSGTLVRADGTVEDSSNSGNRVDFTDPPRVLITRLATDVVQAPGTAQITVIDEDNFASDSATAVPTQQSTKAYVDGRTSAATTDSAGLVELATAGETTTGTDASRAVTPDGLAGSDFGKSVISIMVFDDGQDVVTGDGAGDVFWRVPAVLNGYNLVAVAACVHTAGATGTTDIQIHNITQAADMLTTKLTIDSGETDSKDATPAVIDTSNDDVATGDKLRFDVDAVSTTKPKGLLVELTFQLP